jgi:ATP-dependent 26S proteasome regulatory subunit
LGLSLNASILLDFLEDVNEGSRTRITIMSINREDTLDTALYRPGRVDEEYVMQLPSAAYRRLLITSYQEEETLLTSEEVESLTAETEGFTPAELSELMKSINVLGYKGAANELSRLRRHRALYMKTHVATTHTASLTEGDE